MHSELCTIRRFFAIAQEIVLRSAQNDNDIED